MSATKFLLGKVIVCAGLLLATVDRASAVTFSIKAVKINDAPIAPSAQVSIQPGDSVVAEFYVSGWNQNRPGSHLLTWQFTLDRLSWISGSRGTLLPRGWNASLEFTPCIRSLDCPAEQPTCTSFRFCTLICSPNATCPTEFPVCDNFHCVAPGHDPDGNNAFIDAARPDYVHFGYSPIFAVSTYHLDYSYGGTAGLGDGPLDSGQPRYLGTLALVASDDACGLFTVSLLPDVGLTFVDLFKLPSPLTYTPSTTTLTVHVACATSACCTPRNPCENTSHADCTARGGTWQEGKLCGEGDQTCPRIARPRQSDASR